MYDHGTVIKQRPLGYIYGVEPYEDITLMLNQLQKKKAST